VHSEFDVLVVGAGPAGSIAALRLARSGVSVRVIDRAAFPRDKLCGDTLNPGCVATLGRVDRSTADRVRTFGLTTTGITLTGPGGTAMSVAYEGGLTGAALMRRELDRWLLESAVGAGAQFDSGVLAQAPIVGDTRRVTGVTVQSGAHRFALRARVVIAADGRASRLGSALRLSRFSRTPRRWAFGAYFTDVDGCTAHGEMHIRSNGYVGIAPLPGGLVNVCVVRARSHIAARQSPDQIIGSAIGADRSLAWRFARARRVSPVAVLGPLGVDCEDVGCAGLLLAGDAAGFIDPMTGDGLRFAIQGGDLAARAALGELQTGIPAYRQLRSWRRQEFGGKWRLNRALRTLVGSRRGLSVAELATRAWHAPVEHLVAVAGDLALARRSA
jgi:flavin-dependent dehydrogenase